ncbi:hypothetical protein HDU92_005323 [Lobulomyces angularis]|nr:hypothetical protein HDU92_005323 [Lobulomyces angularis]
MEDHKSSVKSIDTGLKGDFINFLNSEAESEFWLKGQNSIDLFDCMERYHRLDENITKYIFRQVANVTKYLQDNNIFHGDIKEENILINRNLQIKLVDFGSARYITKNNCNTTANNLTGSLSFFPPEVIKGELIQDFFKIDSWCLGILFFGLLYGTMPFSSSEQIIKDDFHADETLTFSEDCMNLLRLLLKKIPSERPNPQQILDSCWLKN